MGYEVLGSDGGNLGLPTADVPASDVIALDDLPTPEPEAPTQRPPRRLPLPLQRVRDRAAPRVSASLAAHATRTTAVLAGGTAAVGLVLGLVWSGHHGDQVREAQARSTVNALASFQSVNRIRTGQGPAIELAVDVFNVGALPIALVTSPAQTRLSYDTPVVTSLSGAQEIAPGTSTPVTARLLLACDSRTPIELAVPVRAPDGEVHRLPMQSSQWQSASLFPADLCNQSDDARQPLEANVAGTLLRPTLELRNWTADPMTVTWGSGGQPGLAQFLEKVDLRLTPALPLTLRPNEQRTLRLSVTAHGCPQGVSLDDLNGYSNLMLHGSGGSGQVGEAWVQVTAVLGAAMQRACD
ncbi:hypothetical protein [Angustibacter luteus]|uniref:Uncharacterized protein n=1 Tax=Angustibacter luteus TaxID=658456 RepID=A0ABW1JDP9_9ACTN